MPLPGATEKISWPSLNRQSRTVISLSPPCYLIRLAAVNDCLIFVRGVSSRQPSFCGSEAVVWSCDQSLGVRGCSTAHIHRWVWCQETSSRAHDPLRLHHHGKRPVATSCYFHLLFERPLGRQACAGLAPIVWNQQRCWCKYSRLIH